MEKKEIAKTFVDSFVRMVEGLVEENARLSAVHGCVTTLFDLMDSDTRSMVLKKILMRVMPKFSTEINHSKSEEHIEKTLDLWRILGKSSKTMGPVVVLETLEESYAGHWQYYRAYAESLIEEGHIGRLHVVFRNCMRNCEMEEGLVRNLFGPEIMKHVNFPRQSEDDDGTVQFVQSQLKNNRQSISTRQQSRFASSNTSNSKLVQKSRTMLKPKKEVDQFLPAICETKKTIVISPKQECSDKGMSVNQSQKPDSVGDNSSLDQVVGMFQRQCLDDSQFPDGSSPTIHGNHKVPLVTDGNDCLRLLESTPIRKQLFCKHPRDHEE